MVFGRGFPSDPIVLSRPAVAAVGRVQRDAREAEGSTDLETAHEPQTEGSVRIWDWSSP